jgi:hypothetical protein
MGLLYGRAGRLNTKNADFRPGQWLPEILLFLGETGGGVFSLFSGVAPDFDGAELLQLKVNGMGCEACQLHVRTTLEMSAGVLSSRVDWEGGTAEVWVG